VKMARSGSTVGQATGRAIGCEVLCDHCSLPVPTGLIEAKAGHQFCCHGCRTAFEVIHSCGLERYYAIRDGAALGSNRGASPSSGTGRRYAEMDDPTFTDLYVKRLPGGLHACEFFLEGVHCAACLWLVERLPVVLEGVLESRLDLRRAMVRLVWDPTRVRLSRIGRTLDGLGYPAHVARDRTVRDVRRSEDRRTLIRIGIAGACAGNVMLLALALYAGLLDAIEAQYLTLFRWTSMVFSAVSVLGPGSVFIRGAMASLRARTVQLDVPIALGLVAGLGWSVVSTVRGTGEVYFDSLSVLVFALLVGRWVQQRQHRWAADSVELLFALTPSTAHLWSGGEPVDTPIEAVKPGDIVLVRAGEQIPVDGRVIEGATEIDLALMTGESRLTRVRAGESVIAGTTSVSGELLVRVEATGESTRVGRLMRLVEEETKRRAPIVKLADRIAGWFVVCMIVLATGTAVGWMLIDPSRAIEHAAALLIVTCPCALGLATPLAMSVAIGRAARRRMLLKGGEPLQLLAEQGLVLLDKTGTITRGRATMVDRWGPLELWPTVSAIESGSSHPVARAICEGLLGESSDPSAARVESAEFGPSGVAATVDGRRFLIGSASCVKGSGARVAGMAADAERRAIEAGHTPVLVACDGEVIGVVSIGDDIRPEAQSVIDRMRRQGWCVGILSGDHPEVVRRVGERLGIDPDLVFGACDPERKLAIVRERLASGHVVMVGDGVNDAAALAAATVGIAVHGGAEASLAAADVYLGSPGLTPILDLLLASRRTMQVIKRNLVFSCCTTRLRPRSRSQVC
jgi:Cu2+-exporting ATPase